LTAFSGYRKSCLSGKVLKKTICYNVLKHAERGTIRFIRLDEDDFINQLIRDLYKQNIQSVIIEGGALTLVFYFFRTLG